MSKHKKIYDTDKDFRTSSRSYKKVTRVTRRVPEGKKRLYKTVGVFSCLFIAVSLVLILNVTGVLSWFGSSDGVISDPLEIKIDDYSTSVLYRNGTSGSFNTLGADTLFDIYDSASPSYIEKTQLCIRSNTISKAYLRVKVEEEFIQNGTTVPKLVDIGYNTDTAYWSYNSDDGYYYYSEMIGTDTLEDQDVIFCTGADVEDNAVVSSCSVKLRVTAEAVQPDRYEELWGLDGSTFIPPFEDKVRP